MDPSNPFLIFAAVIGAIVASIQLGLWLHSLWEQAKWRRKARQHDTQLVVVAIVVKDCRVLMVRRQVPEGRLKWQFPAALVVPTQDIVSRVLDETLRETGIRCRHHRRLSSRLHPDTQKFVVYFALHYLIGEPKNGQPEENSEVKWVDIRDARLLLSSDLSEDVSDYLSLFQDTH